MDVDSETEEKKNATWDIGLTEELVTAVFGTAQWKKAHPSVRSMTDRPEFCRYHYHEALSMMSEYIESKLKETGLLGVYKDYDEFSYLMLKIRANITAFVQSLHAVVDTCSHMLYYSLAPGEGMRYLVYPDPRSAIFRSPRCKARAIEALAGHYPVAPMCRPLRISRGGFLQRSQ